MFKLYKKLDQKLLRSQPKLWELSAIFLSVSIIAIHIIFYIIGFLISEEVMYSYYRVNDHFFSSSLLVLFFILALIVLIVFGFRYYTHNPIKNLYPIGKFYLLKVLFILVFFCFALGLTVYTFQQGVAHGVRAHHTIDEVSEKLYKYANVEPLIAYESDEKSEFFIERRSYPEPFPQDLVTTEVSKQNVFKFSNKDDDDYDSEVYRYNAAVDFTKPYITFDDEHYQFGTLMTKKSPDSCSTIFVLEDVQDVSGVKNLHKYSMYNFSPKLSYKALKFDRTKWVKEFHAKLDRKDRKALQNDLRWILNSRFNTHPYSLSDFDYSLDKIISSLDGELKFKPPNSDSHSFGYEVEQSFRNFDEAFSDLGYGSLGWIEFWTIFLLSLAVAFVLIVTKYIPIIPLIISAVINQVVIFLFTLLSIPVAKVTQESSMISVMYLLLFYSLAIFVYTFWRVRRRSEQRIVYYGIVPGLAASYVFIYTLVILIQHWTRYPDPCIEHSYLNRFEFNLPLVIVLALIATLYNLSLIKKSRSIPQ